MPALLAADASAEVLRVGPGQPITRIADAARLAADGDTIEIEAGVYRGDVAVWAQRKLTIRGLGDGAVLEAGGAAAEGKAIWVVRGGDIRIENITFRGARVPDLNGAGIRFERGELTVRDSRFVDNENGILTGNHPGARLHIEDCLFADAPRHPGALHHLLYVGRIADFHLSGSRFQNGYRAHLVKTRARRSRIEYNFIVDGPDGEAAYELEFPDGGEAIVIGNVIAQSPATTNPAIVSYGAEGYHWPGNRLALSHNTLVDARLFGGRFLHLWPDSEGKLPAALARNNLLVGAGRFDPGEGADHAGNRYRPPHSPQDAGPRNLPPAGRWHGIDLIPRRRFAHPFGTRPISPPARWVAGAMQRDAAP